MLLHFKYQYLFLRVFKMLSVYMYFPACFLHLCILPCLVLWGFFCLFGGFCLWDFIVSLGFLLFFTFQSLQEDAASRVASLI